MHLHHHHHHHGHHRCARLPNLTNSSIILQKDTQNDLFTTKLERTLNS